MMSSLVFGTSFGIQEERDNLLRIYAMPPHDSNNSNQTKQKPIERGHTARKNFQNILTKNKQILRTFCNNISLNKKYFKNFIKPIKARS